MTSPCDQLAGYADGQLDPADADAFALHLAGCAACQAGLHDTLQLVALEATLRQREREAPAQRPAPIIDPPDRLSDPLPDRLPDQLADRRADRPAKRGAPAGRRWAYGASVVAAAAAVLVAVWWQRRTTPEAPGAPVVLAAASTRAMEGRISYAAADRYRPYEVARAGGSAAPSDAIALGTLAELERRGDVHGVAAAFLLMNDAERAAGYLERAAKGPNVGTNVGYDVGYDIASDRALVQRATGHGSDALITLDGVLEAAPRHPQALWNRALVLRDLGLTLSAAQAFTAAAALGEPGWSDEARARAKALSDHASEQKAAIERLALQDGPRLATAPAAVSRDVARRFPGTTRSVFYDAVRSASSPEAVKALAPLANTLDEVYGGTVLAGYVERISHSDFTRRAPLARRYEALLHGQRLDEAGARSLFDQLREAHQPDILVGAIVRVTAAHVPASLIPELRRLGDELHDPWFQLFGIEQAAAAQVTAGNHAAAEALLLPALTSCTAAAIDFRCANLDRVLGESYLVTLRLSDARRVLTDGWERTQRGAEWYIAQPLLQSLARLAAVQDDVVGTTLPLVRAYAGEAVLRQPARCELAAWYREIVALMMVTRSELERARKELAELAAVKRSCPSVPTDLATLDAEAYVLRDPGAGSADDVAALRAQIAALRALPSEGAGDHAPLDQIEGRLLIDRDRASGTALLQRAISSSRAAREDDVDARRARSYAYSILDLEAGRTGTWDRVWTLLGDEAAVAPALRCAVGVAVEDRSTLVVVRDLDGTTRGAIGITQPGSVIDASKVVPAALLGALRDCPTIEVVARPPIHGLPGLLPPELAWSYHSGPAVRTSEPTSAVHRRVVISNPEPPSALGVPRLTPWRSATAPDAVIEGLSATPARVLAELADATFVEIHAHGMVNAAVADASFLMLSPDADGRYALAAGAIRRQPLRGHPIVILGACHAAMTASYRHEAWSLPTAFIAAGARAVIASTDIISDADAGGFFDDLRARIEHGSAPEIALRDTRSAWLAAHPAASWTRSLMVFQ